MSANEFFEAFGSPDNAREVTDGQINNALGRLPESLLEFWGAYGIGCYAAGFFWLCTPDLFDAALERLLLNVPHLRGKLAAFGYHATGQVYLWHKEQRLWTLLLPFPIFDDQTSRDETEPVPFDLEQLYELAGAPRPSDAQQEFLRNRHKPVDIWWSLSTGASVGSEIDYGDDGRPLFPQLQLLHGRLEYGTIYCRRPEAFENVASSYQKRAVQQVIGEMSGTITVIRAIERNGVQELIEEQYPVAR